MPIVFRKNIAPGTELSIWKIAESAEQLYSKLQLDERERAVFDSFKNQHKRSLHWLGSRVLLRTLLKTDKYINLKIDEHRKPYLANLPHHISISHSHDYAAVMVSLDGPVGVDIEEINPKIEKVAARFLLPDELSFIGPWKQREPASFPTGSDRAKLTHLYACWSVKEAIYKWYGKGGLAFQGGIVLNPFQLEPAGRVTARVHLEGEWIEMVAYYQEFNGYMLAWCYGRPAQT
ncbi:MAG: 4'-phosphopantetheinyl transferase superfamily protein [Solitalea sp.]